MRMRALCNLQSVPGELPWPRPVRRATRSARFAWLPARAAKMTSLRAIGLIRLRLADELLKK